MCFLFNIHSNTSCFWLLNLYINLYININIIKINIFLIYIEDLQESKYNCILNVSMLSYIF